MRLLDTTTIELSEFFDADIPPYAILSHTWGKNEVTFQDLDCVRSKGPQAYSKIAACCAKAASHGVKWVWIDTCCIDKSSSAELSEAINSMYRWYEKSEECYAYLEDVSIDNMDQFGSSRWFTRGWTLQELLAPPSLAFYDKDWEYLGSKQDLSKVIALTTKIPESTISLGNFSYKIGSAAAIMSWASKRQTSRIEDTAYCLMGLFDINMPLLYGEGGKAFTRLQHEIVKNQDDESILAWTDKTSKRSGMFARSPAVFANSGDVVRRNFDVFRRPEPSTVTSRGLSMQLVGKVECNDDPKTEWVPIHCSRGKHGEPLMAKIHFFHNSLGLGLRTKPDALMEISESKIRSCELRRVYLKL
ncbi:heterokaryon incompatibility protein-domain-containing protein [Usnea florida]